MPEQLFANVASTTLAASITSAQTSITVVSSANFPAANTLNDQEFRAAFVDTATPPNILEYVAVTQVTGTTWTVTRQVEDPTRFAAAARASGTRIVMVTTRGVLESFERRSRTVGHNVLDYGAVGNSSHSVGGGHVDTTNIQAAVNDAKSSTGQAVVVFPGRRTYNLDAQIVWTTGTEKPVQAVGQGNMNFAGLSTPPTIVWTGAEDGIPIYVGTTSVNIPGALFRNLNIRGTDASGIDSTADLPGASILFWPETGATGTPGQAGSVPGTNAAKIDSGSLLEDMWFQRVKGNAVEVAVKGATNWRIYGGRWDQINGYGVNMRLASQTVLHVYDVTYDSWNGAAVAAHGLGMFHFNAMYGGVSGGATAFIAVHLDTVHPEVNATPIEANPSGTTPADRTGIIHCTVDSTQGLCSHRLALTNTVNQGGATKTRSMVLMLGGAGSTESQRETQRKNRLTLNGREMFGFSGDGTASTGHLIPIGGIPSADKSPYTSGFYNSLEYGAGQTGTDGVFSTDIARFWRRNGTVNS